MSNLISCPTCDHEVSSDAQSCPSCGHKLNSSFIEKAIKVVIYGVGAYAIFAIIFIFFLNSPSGIIDFIIDVFIGVIGLSVGIIILAGVGGFIYSFIRNPPNFMRRR